MPKVSFADQPLHPMLIVVPAGLIPSSFVFDVLGAATGDDRFHQAAYYSLTTAVVGGLMAGAAGHQDLRMVPEDHPARKVGVLHATLNVSIVLLSVLNLWLRRRRASRSGGLPFLLSALSAVTVLFTTWLGRELVYRYGMRVEGVSPVADAPELEIPGGEAIGETFRVIEQAAINRGL